MTFDIFSWSSITAIFAQGLKMPQLKEVDFPMILLFNGMLLKTLHGWLLASDCHNLNFYFLKKEQVRINELPIFHKSNKTKLLYLQYFRRF